MEEVDNFEPDAEMSCWKLSSDPVALISKNRHICMGFLLRILEFTADKWTTEIRARKFVLDWLRWLACRVRYVVYVIRAKLITKQRQKYDEIGRCCNKILCTGLRDNSWAVVRIAKWSLKWELICCRPHSDVWYRSLQSLKHFAKWKLGIWTIIVISCVQRTDCVSDSSAQFIDTCSDEAPLVKIGLHLLPILTVISPRVCTSR